MTDPFTRTTRTFTSYLEIEALNGSEDALQSTLKPKLLSSELEIARAPNTILFSPTSKIKESEGIKGLLVVTNFKLSFLTNDYSNSKNESSTYQENIFLGKNDVTLSSIESVYQITDKKKKLVAHDVKISSKIEALHIICKNFRVLKFGFKKSDVGIGKKISEALLKFAFLTRHNLSFSYNFKENYYNTLKNTSMFNKKLDWNHELIRCGAIGWRVLSLEREDNIPTGSLPIHFVIPKSVTETEYLRLANFFRNYRTAIWVFSLDNASLVRMAELMPTITDTKQENQMLELVRKCDPLMRQPCILELSKLLPSIQDVYISYVKLKELCTPDSTRQFMEQDSRFFTLLEKSCWLLYVSLCLKYSTEASYKMRKKQTVVLQETDGRDMCCVISSLTQIILDPYSRTTIGFQSLIQKEWIALGHPFSDRLGHVINSDTTEQSPLFLLFLDCTWQLLQQFPEEFEFSETFLTTIWDSAFIPIFDTFQFNSEHDRQSARKNERLILRPVWDWGEQFTDKDLLLFNNPMYKRPPEQSRKSMAVLGPSALGLPGIHNTGSRSTVNFLQQFQQQQHQQQQQQPHQIEEQRRFLEPRYSIRDLEIWMQCYYRWIPILEIKNGGYPQIELFNRMILSNISKLQQAIQSQDFDELPRTSTPPSELIMPSINSFFPFSGYNNINSNELNDIFTLSHEVLAEGSIFDGLSLSQGPD